MKPTGDHSRAVPPAYAADETDDGRFEPSTIRQEEYATLVRRQLELLGEAPDR